MQDIELYRQLLGLNTPWTVSRVELKVKEQRVEVWAGHAEGVHWRCPECATELPVYDHAEQRPWHHLDSCQFQTYLHARLPRVGCPSHGVPQVRLPWAERRARFTTLFERLAIDVLRETDVKGATRILRISWDEAWELKRRAVARGRARQQPHVPARLGVDETAVARRHNYLMMVCDLETGTLQYVADDPKQTSLDAYFTSLTLDQRAQIQAVAMDMWEPYVRSLETHVPRADREIVFNVFHIMQHMNEAVDRVRRPEHRKLRQQGDEILTGSK
jgi:transposase